MGLFKKILAVFTEISYMLAALASVFFAFAFYKLYDWMIETFGSVTLEQFVFFLKAPLKGVAPVIKASFTDSIIKQPLIIAGILILPGLIGYFALMIFKKFKKEGATAPTQLPPPPHFNIIFLALLCALLGSVAAYPFINDKMEPTKFYNVKPSENVLSDPRFLIAHAGGAIDGLPYTNSLEAINNSLKSGFKFIELDMATTKEMHIAAVHDWSFFKGIAGIEKNDEPMSDTDFKLKKIYEKYTPLLSYDINNFLIKNTDIVLVTDKIKDLDVLTETFKYPERLIVEVFSIKDYHNALDSGILYPAYSLNSAEKVETEKILKEGIKMVTVSDVYLERFPFDIKYLHQHGVTVMLYGPTKVINNPEYLKSVLGKTVSMAYVDYCSPTNPECKK